MNNMTRAGAVLARLTAAPALLLVAWLAAGFPLLMAGAFRPLPVLALFVPVAAAALAFGLRGVRPIRCASWWPLVGVVAVAVAFCAFQLVMVSEQIVVRRDPASYFNFATWLTGHGSLPIPVDKAAFGGGDPTLSYGSAAFFQRGAVLVPQFMAGTPMVAAAGGWIGGARGLLGAMPVLGGLAVLSFGGLTARLVSPRWAPAGALMLALAWPMMMISRAIYSETTALVLTLGGLALILDALRSDRERFNHPRIPALLGGLALGLTVLVRIDGLRDVLPVLAFGGLLLGLRRRVGPPLLAGLVLGAGAGLGEGYAMSRPYLELQRGSLIPLLYIAAAVTVATVAVSLLVRRHGLPDCDRFRLPDLVLPVTFTVMALFAARPYLQTVRRVPHTVDDRINAIYIAALQRSQGLPPDPDRQYSELSLHWVTWYIGVPAVLLATIGAALIARNLLRRRRTEWALPYAMIVWTTVTTLWRPAITPDQPWASRRLIQVVIPGLLLFALWALAWTTRRARRLGYGRRVAAGVAACGTLLVLVPTVATSSGLMFTRTENGEVAQARAMCEAIGPNSAAIIVDRLTADRFSQVIRGMCDTPTARVRVLPGAQVAPPGDVARVARKVAAGGRRPVMLGDDPTDVTPYGRVSRVFHVHGRRDPNNLTSRPKGTSPLALNVWMAQPVHGR
jgi:hypothetical protein